MSFGVSRWAKAGVALATKSIAAAVPYTWARMACSGLSRGLYCNDEINASSKHRGQDTVRRPVAIHEGLDVDDDLFAHVDAAFQRGRAHMRQQDNLALARQPQQPRIDRWLVIEHVEARAGDVPGLYQARERVLVDHITARRVDDVSVRTDELESARRQKMIGAGRVRTIDGNNVHPRQHLVETIPIGGADLFFDHGRD